MSEMTELNIPELEELKRRVQALEDVIKAMALGQPLTCDDLGRLIALPVPEPSNR